MTTIETNVALASGQLDAEQAFWLSHIPRQSVFSGFPHGLASPGTGTAELSIPIPAAIGAGILRVGKGSQLGAFVVFSSGVAWLLAKYARLEEVLLATPVFARGLTETPPNRLIPLYATLDGARPFREHLATWKEVVRQSIHHQNFPLEVLCRLLEMPVDSAKRPVVKTAVLFESLQEHRMLEDYSPELVFSVALLESGGRLTLSYDQRAFDEGYLRALASHLFNFFRQVLEAPDTCLEKTELLEAGELSLLLHDFNATESSIPTKETVIARFEERVREAPEEEALVFGEARLTRRQLDEQANRLAHLLLENGVKRGDVVGILLQPSLEIIIAILGVMKCGAAYLPIDLEAPDARMAYILKDSGVTMLVTERTDVTALGFSGTIVSPRDRRIEEMPAVRPCVEIDFSDVAYVIHTSGTTGNPKGVMIEHGSLVNLCLWHNRYFGVTSGDRAAQCASFGFDASVESIFPYLIEGAAIFVVDLATQLDLEAMSRYFDREGITLTFLPTRRGESLIEGGWEPKGLRALLIGGEQQQFFRRRTYAVYNIYGPAENTVATTAYLVSEESSNIPIGKPIANTRVYILDRSLKRLQPPGIPGELCISSAGLARGYLNKDALTARKFLENPYLPGERMYRTGDLARWFPDGNLEYLGRMDNQVKVSGFRFETGEVEACLLEIDALSQAVVRAMTNEAGRTAICAWVVRRKPIRTAEIRRELKRRLPYYMVPDFILFVETLPLNSNGKVNFARLPPPGALEDELVTPRDAVERGLATLWSEVLEVDQGKIGVDTSFYALGGHSLRATTLHARIRRHFDVDIPLSLLLRESTLGEQAETIRQAAGQTIPPSGPVAEEGEKPSDPVLAEVSKGEETTPEGVSSKEPGYVLPSAPGKSYYALPLAPKKPFYRLSPAQRRLFILYQLEARANTTYNVPFALELEGTPDLERLEEALKTLVAWHDSLRTSFHVVEGEPVQQIEEAVPFRIERHQGDPGAADRWLKRFVRPFDLAKAPLFRCGLFTMAPEQHLLAFDMHHIISDAISVLTLSAGFLALYGGETFPEPRLQYKDYSEWQTGVGYRAGLGAHEVYWAERFADGIPVLELPVDFPRPPVRDFAGRSLSVRVESSQTAALRAHAIAQDTTLFTALLAGFGVFLSRLTGQDDIVIGSPVAGRTHPDLEGVVGMFVNMLPLRCRISHEATFEGILQEVKGAVLEGLKHQEYPFEELVEKLDVRRDPSRHPLFDVVFVMQPETLVDMTVPGLVVRPRPLESTTSKFDLTFYIFEEDDSLVCTAEYCTALFEEESIRRFIRQFLRTLEVVIGEPDRSLSVLDFLEADERTFLLGTLATADADYPREKTLVQLFEEQVSRAPERTAVLLGDVAVSYRALDTQSNLIAKCLRDLGLANGQIVGLLLERSPEQVGAVLGALKAGGAYLPIDVDDPKERVAFVLKDSGACCLLTTRGQDRDLEFPGPRLFLDGLAEGNVSLPTLPEVPGREVPAGAGPSRDAPGVSSPYPQIDASRLAVTAAELPDRPVVTADPSSLAYVIYTSGTTGRPKGVMITHQNVVQLLFDEQLPFSFGEDDVWTMFHSYCFDFSVWEMFGALLYGGRLVIVPKRVARDPVTFRQLLETEGVTVLNQTPSAFYNLQQEELERPGRLGALRYVIFGGEALKPSRIRPWFDRYPDMALVNMYGITETTVHVTWKRLGLEDIEWDRNNIGLPLPTVSAYVVDPYLRMQPVGVFGELCVGGAGVGLGYLNRADLTEKRFVQSPFRPGEVLYRSGDVARVLANGDLEYRGRSDQQVQVRGFRVEPGEVESTLGALEGIDDVVVIDQEDAYENKYLSVYMVTRRPWDALALRAMLAQRLPDHMIPARFYALAAIPLTRNGKRDIDAMVRAGRPLELGGAPAEPASERERRLLEIWRSVLNNPGVGVDDNFFDAGGNSLLLIQLFARMEEELAGALRIVDLFTFPTVRKLAARLEQAGARAITLPCLALPPEYFVLPGQARQPTGLLRTLEGATLERLVRYAQTRDVRVTDVLVAMYVHTFFEVAGLELVPVHVLAKRRNRIVSLTIDLTSVVEVDELVSLVAQGIIGEAESIGVDELNLVQLNKDSNTIRALVVDKALLQSNVRLLGVFDMVLEIEVMPETVTLACEASPHLARERMEAFSDAYLQVLRVALEQE